MEMEILYFCVKILFEVISFYGFVYEDEGEFLMEIGILKMDTKVFIVIEDVLKGALHCLRKKIGGSRD